MFRRWTDFLWYSPFIKQCPLKLNECVMSLTCRKIQQVDLIYGTVSGNKRTTSSSYSTFSVLTVYPPPPPPLPIILLIPSPPSVVPKPMDSVEKKFNNSYKTRRSGFCGRESESCCVVMLCNGVFCDNLGHNCHATKTKHLSIFGFQSHIWDADFRL